MRSHSSQNHTKSLSSEEDTRNPTTNKKAIYYTPVQKHSHPRYMTPNQKNSLNKSSHNRVEFQNEQLKNKCRQLNHSMYQLRQRKQSCMKSSRYNQAKQLNDSLESIQRKRARTQFKHLITEHQLQHKMIKKAHKKEMKKFQQVWQNYFIGLKAKEQFTLIHFRKAQQHDIKFVQEELVEKCKSLKLRTGELKSLEKKEKQLRKLQRLDQLVQIKKQKKQLKQKILLQQHQKIYNWAKRQQDFLKTYHTKKYNALINRIEEIHNDKYRQYQREGQRLRLKYHNVVKKLQHQQKLEINELLEKYSSVKEEFKGRSLTVNV